MTWDFKEIFEQQKKLDAHIVENMGLEGVNTLSEKVLALRVETAEMANEGRFFKFWKQDRTPKKPVQHLCPHCREGKIVYLEADPETCDSCNGNYLLGTTDNLLMEYVDMIHFMTSISLDLGFDERILNAVLDSEADRPGDLTELFNDFYSSLDALQVYFKVEKVPNWVIQVPWTILIHIGKRFGYSSRQVMAAYRHKNEINHTRQEEGY